MVKKANSNLTINTAVRKDTQVQTIINLSRVISVPVTYMLNGKKVSLMLPPSSREELPEGAKVLTSSEYLKVLQSN